MQKVNFDPWYYQPELWSNFVQQYKNQKVVLETTFPLSKKLRLFCQQNNWEIFFNHHLFHYQPENNQITCQHKPLIFAAVQFFYQKAVQHQRQLTLIYADGTVKNYYFGSQEAYDIPDPLYPKTKYFADRSGVKFAINQNNIVGVVFQAEAKILDEEWKNFALLEHLQILHLSRNTYQILGYN